MCKIAKSLTTNIYRYKDMILLGEEMVIQWSYGELNSARQISMVVWPTALLCDVIATYLRCICDVFATDRLNVCPTYSRGRHKSEYKVKKSSLSDLRINIVVCPITKLDRPEGLFDLNIVGRTKLASPELSNTQASFSISLIESYIIDKP